TTAFHPDSQELELGEIGKVPDAHATDLLSILVTNKVRGGKVVAVEFFFERAVLLAHIDRAADGDHPRHFVHRSNDIDAYGILRNGFNSRNVIRAVEHLQMLRNKTVVACARGKSERLQDPETFLGHRT